MTSSSPHARSCQPLTRLDQSQHSRQTLLSRPTREQVDSEQAVSTRPPAFIQPTPHNGRPVISTANAPPTRLVAIVSVTRKPPTHLESTEPDPRRCTHLARRTSPRPRGQTVIRGFEPDSRTRSHPTTIYRHRTSACSGPCRVGRGRPSRRSEVLQSALHLPTSRSAVDQLLSATARQRDGEQIRHRSPTLRITKPDLRSG